MRTTYPTFATSEDGRTYSQVGRDIRFTYGRSKGPADVESQSLLVLAPAPMDKGKPLPARYVRIHIEAPKVIIDEIIINPLAVRQSQAEPES